MNIICITGGMGSGKSTVAKIIEACGYPVYYSDERAKRMYFLPEVKQEIIRVLGDKAYLSDKEINKKYIASKIFSDKEILNQVNGIIHRAVKKDFQAFVELHKESKCIFKESALIFEVQLINTCDKIILVTAPKAVRIQRIKKRDNLSEEEIIQRMKNQIDDEEKILRSHFIIENNEYEPLLPKVLDVIEKCIEK